MRLESISPLTTNSSSELYIFEHTTKEEIEKLIAATKNNKFEITIKSLDSINTIVAECCEFDSSSVAERKATEAFKEGIPLIFVMENNNVMTRYEYYDPEFSTLPPNEATINLQRFIENHTLYKEHLG